MRRRTAIRRRGFLVLSGLAAVTELQRDVRFLDTGTDPSAEDAEFIDCETVEIEGEFEEVSMTAHTYERDGFDTYSAEFGPVEGTTQLPPDDFDYFSEGINGYLIPSVRLYNADGELLDDVENPNIDECEAAIRPDTIELTYDDATASDGVIEARFVAENPNDSELSPPTTIEPAVETYPPDAYEPGETAFTLGWEPDADDEQLSITLDFSTFGYDDETVSAATPSAEAIRTEAFDPELRLDCYVARVEAEAYDTVELTFADGTTETFDDGYSGPTEFGFRGDGRISEDAATAVDEFYGPIVELTVTAGDATEMVERDGDCVFDDLEFDCDELRHGRADDVRIAFADSSFKMWDPPVDPDQNRFGSPGRVIETVTEESADIRVENPDLNCDPGEYATVFDCTEVTVGDAEFTADPEFDRATLNFADGSTQAFGELADGPNFTAPETFAGTDDHEGKEIESVHIDIQGGDVFFNLANPGLDDCEPAEAFDPEVTIDRYAATVEADAYDSVTFEFGDASETLDGEFSGEMRFGYAGDESLWADSEAEPGADLEDTEHAPTARTFETFHGPIERCTVERGEQSYTAEATVEEPVITAVAFDCSTVECTGSAADIRVYYGDGSFDWSEREQSGTFQFGSPGRRVGGVYFADHGLWVPNPNDGCDPNTDSIEFDCRAVRLTPEEFGPASAEINRVKLSFADGSAQVFGSDDAETAAFDAPAVFAGLDDHLGSVISQVVCELPGDDMFVIRTNPSPDSCASIQPEDVECCPTDDAATIAGNETEVVSSAESLPEGDLDRSIREPPSGHPEPAATDEAIEEPQTEASGLLGDVPWWGWVAATGGAAGAGSYALSRAVGTDDEAIGQSAVEDSAQQSSEASMSDAANESTLDDESGREDGEGSV